uniref:Uncharacterized protein n=1 Tax=Oryza meridionalis TaxID=40149 RepID=A0A0E0E9A2_9ORYZ
MAAAEPKRAPGAAAAAAAAAAAVARYRLFRNNFVVALCLGALVHTILCRDDPTVIPRYVLPLLVMCCATAQVVRNYVQMYGWSVPMGVARFQDEVMSSLAANRNRSGDPRWVNSFFLSI